MRKELFTWIFVLLLMPFVQAGCQTDAKANSAAVEHGASDIFVSESVVRFAEQMGFKYVEVLEKAKKGDRKAIRDFLEFHGTTDGMDAINHAVTCLELIPVAGDENMALTCKYVKPKLNQVLLERFTLAQGRTHNEDLRKPMAEWAPMTWAAINNLPIPGLCDMKSEVKMEKPNQPKAAEVPVDKATEGGTDVAPKSGGQ